MSAIQPWLHDLVVQLCGGIADHALEKQDNSDALDAWIHDTLTTCYIHVLRDSLDVAVKLTPHVEPQEYGCITLVKRSVDIDFNTPLGDQVDVLWNPFASQSSLQGPSQMLESVQRVVHSSVRAALQAYAIDRGESSEKRGGLAFAQRKLVDLENSLALLSSNSDIPNVEIQVPQVIHDLLDRSNGASDLKDILASADQQLIDDPHFYRTLYKHLQAWSLEIDRLNTNEKHVDSGTAAQEIQYWLSLQRTIEEVQLKLASRPVSLVAELLNNKRFYTTAVNIFADNKNRLDVVLAKAQRTNIMMKDFPLELVTSAMSMADLTLAVAALFSHIDKKLKASMYPVDRIVHLLELVSGDIRERLLLLLLQSPSSDTKQAQTSSSDVSHKQSPSFMLLPISRFQAIVHSADELFDKWSSCAEALKDTMRDALKKSAGSRMRLDIHPAFNDVRIRIAHLASLKRDITQFQLAVNHTPSLAQYQQGLAQAEILLSHADPFDMSQEGHAAWSLIESDYAGKVSTIEKHVIMTVSDHLAQTSSTKHMSQVFSQFTPLLYRSRVRSAVADFQSSLVDDICININELSKRAAQAHAVSPLLHARQISPTITKILWLDQLRLQVSKCIDRAHSILGDAADDYVVAQKALADAELMRASLDTASLFQSWLHEARVFGLDALNDPIFSLETQEGHILVTFNAHFSDPLFKQVDSLQSMGYSVPASIIDSANDSRLLYPLAVSLAETLRVYYRAMSHIERAPEIAPLVARAHSKCHELLFDLRLLTWSALRANMEKSLRLVKDLAFQMDLFLDLAERAACTHTHILESIQRMHIVHWDRGILCTLLEDIQSSVDSLASHGTVNLGLWIDALNSNILRNLESRALSCLRLDPLYFSIGSPPLLNPPLVHARSLLYDAVNSHLTQVSGLPVILAAAPRLPDTSAVRPSFSVSPNLIPCYAGIEDALNRLDTWARPWTAASKYWDFSDHEWSKQLSKPSPLDTLNAWTSFMSDARSLRTAMQTWDPRLAIKSDLLQLHVDARLAKQACLSKISLILSTMGRVFAELLAETITNLYHEILEYRRKLEASHGTSFAPHLVDALPKLRLVSLAHSLRDQWAPLVAAIETGESIVTMLPVFYESSAQMLISEYTAFSDMLDQSRSAMLAHHAVLSTRLLQDAAEVGKDLNAVADQWASLTAHRTGTLTKSPQDPFAQSSPIALRITQIAEHWASLHEAARLLEVPLPHAADVNVQLESLQSDVSAMQTVHASLAQFSLRFNDIADEPWASVQPRQVRTQLVSLLDEARAAPSHIRQYAPFAAFLDNLARLTELTPRLQDLKSPVILDKHWRTIASHAAMSSFNVAQASLSDVWDVLARVSPAHVTKTLQLAQGEHALNDFFTRISSRWKHRPPETVAYRDSVLLLASWDVLFAELHDDLNSLDFMRSSPFFASIEADVAQFHALLESALSLYDQWIDIQRQWVYMDGLARQHTLLASHDHQRLVSSSADFTRLASLVAHLPNALEIVNIPNISASLARVSGNLARLKKALADLLARERAAFPRFSFVGDDDLLTVLGTGHVPVPVLRKIFLGIASLIYKENEASEHVIGVVSPRGEQVFFRNSLPVDKNVKIFMTALEVELRETLRSQTKHAVRALQNSGPHSALSTLIGYPTQIALLAESLIFCRHVESGVKGVASSWVSALLKDIQSLGPVKDPIVASRVHEIASLLVHQESLAEVNPASFDWSKQLRHYMDDDARVRVRVVNCEFDYGFEYDGAQPRLVRTNLTQTCFVALTQALRLGLGGSPFGPAGTGKTETVKALAIELGRPILVFNCDDTFDTSALSRILAGVTALGAWGCFDEFNRLSENVMSAVSDKILNIQMALRHTSGHEGAFSNGFAKLNGSSHAVAADQSSIHPNTGLFITMNPNYIGRSRLPENLRSLFRSFAMTKPDYYSIAQVLLYSRGFAHSKELASVAVIFFEKCAQALSHQSHYDFGLRALKSAISVMRIPSTPSLSGEFTALYDSIETYILPRVVDNDVPAFRANLDELMPDVSPSQDELTNLYTDAIHSLGFCASAPFTAKVRQLAHIHETHTGLIVLGSAGARKTTCWYTHLMALAQVRNCDVYAHTIDPKTVSKETLFGRLDPTTREWTDGFVSNLLRRIIDRNDTSAIHYIVFDGDVDPTWAESLNSALDDNKLLTLASGERLALPSNVRILFESDSLDHATMATVSRCGMLWLGNTFEKESFDFTNVLSPYRQIESTQFGSSALFRPANITAAKTPPPLLNPTYAAIVSDACKQELPFCMGRPLLSTVLRTLQVLGYESDAQFAQSLMWALGGAASAGLPQLAKFIGDKFSFLAKDLLYAKASTENTWVPVKVPQIENAEALYNQTGFVVPTIDTIRYEDIISRALMASQPVLLCGPPGSGKTMMTLNLLRAMPNVVVVFVNLNASSDPSTIVKALEQHCEYEHRAGNVTLRPADSSKRVVLFLDEINLPDPDAYGTCRVTSFLRQLIERSGFFTVSNKTRTTQWVTVEGFGLVGACNPATDPGRKELSARFKRHMLLLEIAQPSEPALKTIYTTLLECYLRSRAPVLVSYAAELASGMIEMFIKTQAKLSMKHAHYVYSPRELTLWVRGLVESIPASGAVPSFDDLCRIWTHEGLRLFADRLVDEQERQWTEATLFAIAKSRLRAGPAALQKPILFSRWLSKDYKSVSPQKLAEYLRARLALFAEEEGLEMVPILFDQLLNHLLIIDRALRQVQGHLWLLGSSGFGKKTLVRFVAWMSNMTVVPVVSKRSLTLEDFDEQLRTLLKRSGLKDEKIVFLLDESLLRNGAFVERLNTLLANAQIPGLFDDEEFPLIMASCKEQAPDLYTHDELYDWFTARVAANLHLVFTSTLGSQSPEALFKVRTESQRDAYLTTSPALFNRCVIDYMGDWTPTSQATVAKHLFHTTGLEVSQGLGSSLNQIHETAARVALVSPRHFVAFTNLARLLMVSMTAKITDEQQHLSRGLEKLRTTAAQVSGLQTQLAQHAQRLELKTSEANATLQDMLQGQRLAEKEREYALRLQSEIAQQRAAIAERQSLVQQDLAQVEPALNEARASVMTITKQNLSEVRSMAHPPEPVKLVLEAVCLILGLGNNTSWRTVQSFLRRDDFTSSVVNFDGATLSRDIRYKVEDEYLNRTGFTYDAIFRASRACAPLYDWIVAELEFGRILEEVAPKRFEVDSLRKEEMYAAEQLARAQDAASHYEYQITLYKESYGALVAEAQRITTDVETTRHKLARSEALVSSLQSEKTRWAASAKLFDDRILHVPGDALLSSAFVTYASALAEDTRGTFMRDVVSLLGNNGVSCHDALDPRYGVNAVLNGWLNRKDGMLSMSTPVHESSPLSHHLRAMLVPCLAALHTSRPPLLIDPTGQGTVMLRDVLQNVSVVSSADRSFSKSIEKALRFGNTLLVTDIEQFDPVILPLLGTRSDAYSGSYGRYTIFFAGQLVDVSPSFRIVFSSYDPSCLSRLSLATQALFTPVNFVVSSATIKEAAFVKLLASVKPEMYAKNVSVQQSSVALNARLASNEADLLATLSNTGDLLADDRIVHTLESLKADASSLHEQMSGLATFSAELDATKSQFDPITSAASRVFNVLRVLPKLHPLYCFDAEFLMDTLTRVLSQHLLTSSLETVLEAFFTTVYNTVSVTLLATHKLSFALSLAMLKLLIMGSLPSEPLIQASDSPKAHATSIAAKEPLFGPLAAYLAKPPSWQEFCRPTKNILSRLGSSYSVQIYLWCILMQWIFPERSVHVLETFAMHVLNVDTLSPDYKSLSRATHKPLAVQGVTGFDAAPIAEALRAPQQTHETVTLGSKEAEDRVHRCLDRLETNSETLIVQNIHLASPAWLEDLERRVRSWQPYKESQLILTLQFSPQIDDSSASLAQNMASLLQACTQVTVEPAPGIDFSVARAMEFIRAKRIEHLPLEANRVLFLISYLHGLVQENARLAPLGWTKAYLVGTADLDTAVNISVPLIDDASHSLSHINPSSPFFPWNSLRYMLVDVTYGALMDASQDTERLAWIVDKLFVPRAYESGFSISLDSGSAISLTQEVEFADFEAWARANLARLGQADVLGTSSSDKEIHAMRLGLQRLSSYMSLLDI